MTIGAFNSSSAMSSGILDPGVYNGGGYSTSGYTSYYRNSITNRTNENNVATSTNINTIQRNISSSYSNDAAEAYLMSGDIDAAIATYKATLNDARNSITSNYGYALSDIQTNSIAGNSLNSSEFMQSIIQNTNGSFMTGLLKGIPLFGFFAEDTSTQEAIAELNNSEVSTKHKCLEKLGGATVPAAMIAAGAFLASGPIGWIVMGVGALGLISGLSDKATGTVQA